MCTFRALLCGADTCMDSCISAPTALGYRKYTVPCLLEFTESLRAKAVVLGSDWDANRVQQALWSAAATQMQPKKPKKAKKAAKPKKPTKPKAVARGKAKASRATAKQKASTATTMQAEAASNVSGSKRKQRSKPTAERGVVEAAGAGAGTGTAKRARRTRSQTARAKLIAQRAGQ